MKTKIKPGQIVTFAWARDLKEWDTPRLIVLGAGLISESYKCYCYFSPEPDRQGWLGTIFDGIHRCNLISIPEVKTK
jgi:hypothetical protein